jgi:hypothetical protein
MKKLLVFILFLVPLFLLSCSVDGKDPSDTIGLGVAFGAVIKTSSYWIWLVAIIIIELVATYFIIRAIHNGVEISNWVFFVMLVVLALAIFMRPCEIAFNTTVEQYNRGVLIGY